MALCKEAILFLGTRNMLKLDDHSVPSVGVIASPSAQTTEIAIDSTLPPSSSEAPSALIQSLLDPGGIFNRSGPSIRIDEPAAQLFSSELPPVFSDVPLFSSVAHNDNRSSLRSRFRIPNRNTRSSQSASLDFFKSSCQ